MAEVIGPNGATIATETYDPNEGIPNSLDNRAAIIADRLGWHGPVYTIDDIRKVLIAAEELDDKVRVRAEDRELSS